ncbi:hypothetical protein QBC36DRAFT_232934 [Triangularia setosa]|uniref:Uncharacterized protein n=1 Tax=Triangularia setosa TaxID=2587417 RepID=A0AAN6WCH7_9PEZI|nr:hypothetical protein QBC36DRAFT_232934 [Podospora setosa]
MPGYQPRPQRGRQALPQRGRQALPQRGRGHQALPQEEHQAATAGEHQEACNAPPNTAHSSSFHSSNIPGRREHNDGDYPTLGDGEEYLSEDFENDEENDSTAWWAIRSARAQEAAHVIAKGVVMGDPRWNARSMVPSTAAAGYSAAESWGSLRGGSYPRVLPYKRDGRVEGRNSYKHGARDGVRKRIWKRQSLDVVGEEEDAVVGVTETGGRLDTSKVAEEHGCGGGSDASVSERLSVSVGEGTVEREGFEVVSATELVGTKGSRKKEGKLRHHHSSVDIKDGHQQQQDRDQDHNGSHRGNNKRKSARSWLASWFLWRSKASSSAAPKNKKNTAMEIKMDDSGKRPSSTCPPMPPARGSSSWAGGNNASTIVRNDKTTAVDKEDEPRPSIDQASHTSSWSMVDDIAKSSTNTSDTNVTTMTSDDENTTDTQPPPTKADNIIIKTNTHDEYTKAVTNDGATTTAEPEGIDYASMVGEARSYYGIDSGKKDKGKMVVDDTTHRYHDIIQYAAPIPPPPGFGGCGGGGGNRYRTVSTGLWEGRKKPWLSRRTTGDNILLTDEEPEIVTDECRGWMRQVKGCNRLPLDQRGPSPVPEERRHRANQAAAAVAAVAALNSGGYEGVVVRPAIAGPPDILGNDLRGGGQGRNNGNRALSYAEAIMNAKRNKAAQAVQAAVLQPGKKKLRLLLPGLLPDIVTRGLGRLVGRVIGHGGEKEGGEKTKVVEEAAEEVEEQGGVGVGEHRKNVVAGSVFSSGSSAEKG